MIVKTALEVTSYSLPATGVRMDTVTSILGSNRFDSSLTGKESEILLDSFNLSSLSFNVPFKKDFRGQYQLKVIYLPFLLLPPYLDFNGLPV